MTALRFPEHPPTHPLNQLPDAVFRGGDFEPKLTFEQRCGVLALYKCNISVAVLAAAFGINRRTVNKIIKPESRAYKNVRDEAARLGDVDFLAKYTTEDLLAKVAAAKVMPEVAEPRQVYDQNAADRRRAPNARATQHSGISTVKEERHEYTHRIEVKWLEENTAVDSNGPFDHPAGWYWRDLDGDTPDYWNGDPDASTHFTSASALKHAREFA